MTRRPALQVNRTVNPPYGSNTYLLTQPVHPNGLIIDPGNGVDSQFTSQVKTSGVHIEYAVLTHEHYDHISGLPALKKYWNCQVICSRACSAAITDPTRNLSRYLIQRDVACAAADRTWEDLGGELDWHGVRIRCVATPGHSSGSICIAVENLLFTGDCLLPNLKRVANLPGGNKQALEQSLALLMETFDPETLVYPGHGEPFQLKDVTNVPVFCGKRDRYNS